MTVTVPAPADTSTWPVGPAPATKRRTSTVVEWSYGHRAVAGLSEQLSALATYCGAPLTSRPGWLLAASEASANLRPWALVARDDGGTPLGAVVLLDHTRQRRAVLTTLAGTDGGHRGTILTRDTAVAYDLGDALCRALDEQHRPAPLALGPLPADQPVVHAFAEGLHGSSVDPADDIPVIRRDAGAEPRDYLAAGMRRTLRKATNRLAADGREATTRFTCDVAEIRSLLPQLELVHRHRDHVHGRISDLDDVVPQRTWQRRVRDLTSVGVLELAMLHVDGELAAYTFGVPDGSAYRLLEGRFVTEWARYSPGRLLEAAVAERALSDEAVTTFDWMTAVAPESLLGRNDADPMVVVRLGEPTEPTQPPTDRLERAGVRQRRPPTSSVRSTSRVE
ncbi:MAG: GNAT family N-acetyltransferase [Actinomycetes bacterium]